MEYLIYSYYRFGFILQIVAIIHFIRKRPDWWWLLVIFLGGGLGAIVYIVMVLIPDVRGTDSAFKPRTISVRQRRKEAEARVAQNPSPGNYEELGDIYLEEGKYQQARACYDKAIGPRTQHPDPYYRRALCELQMGDFAAALPDLEYVVTRDPKYDFHRAIGLLAHAQARTGRADQAARSFQQAVATSSAAETEYHYAEFLAAQGRAAEAREWAERVLAKRATAPDFLRRRDRPWYDKAAALLAQLGTAR